MSDPMRDNDRSPKYLESLEHLLHSYRPRSVHYVGYAHPEVLTCLMSVVKADHISVMDYWNRYGLETEFDYDTGERVHDCLLPKEFHAITFYVEGGPESELLIFDMPWHFDYQLRKILKFKAKNPPRYILLSDEAMQVELHQKYSWTDQESCLIGVRRSA